MRLLSTLECAGGGQVVVENGYAYIGHINAPHGTTIADVRDPLNPRIVGSLQVPRGVHSHKVRVKNDLMLINMERIDDQSTEKTGLDVYDISRKDAPRLVSRWETAGNGVHRFTYDGDYAYISPDIQDYHGNILMILDLKNPVRPAEVGRWWLKGQHVSEAEHKYWSGESKRCHHAIRHADRLYLSYWHGGGFILDISDMANPKELSNICWNSAMKWPTHSLVPVPFKIHGHDWMLVADEDVDPQNRKLHSRMPAALWMVNITDPEQPVPVSSFQVEGVDGGENLIMTGCHQPVEHIRSAEVPVAWFEKGLRVLDISNPRALKEVAYYVPEQADGARRVCSNDVFQDDRGFIYLIDRLGGLSILERT
ncbi:MAG: hypothetical protein JWQ07_4233 [Ramlibacter sp.]|nr:hypothetical protein [Ramlibacter sp.]